MKRGTGVLIRGWLIRGLCGLAIAVHFVSPPVLLAQRETQNAAREALEAGGLDDQLGNDLLQQNDDFSLLDISPPPAYSVAQRAFFRGELTRAISILTQLQRELARQREMRHVLGQIPVRTLLGECYVQAGDLVSAAAHYDAALQVVIDNPTFLSSVQWNALANPLPEAAQDALPPRAARLGFQGTTNLELWPSAKQVQLVRLRRHLLVDLPPQNWIVSPEMPDDFDQLLGLDVAEMLRQISVAAYRLRWLRGKQVLLGDPVGQRLLAATTPPGVVGTRRGFRSAGALVFSTRTALRYFAGDDSNMALVDRLDDVGGGYHPLTPITRLTRLRCRANQWCLSREFARGQIEKPADQIAVVPPSSDDRIAFVKAAVATSDIAFALAQFQLGVDSFSLALDELACWKDGRELANQLERDLIVRSESLRNEAPSIAFQLRVLAGRASLLAGRRIATGNHLVLADRFRSSRRLDLPRSTAFARWLQLQVEVSETGSVARLNPGKDPRVSLQTLKEIEHRKARWTQSLDQVNLFASGIQSNEQHDRSITHPLAFRFRELGLPNRARMPVATRSQRYQSHWRESLAGQDLSAFDQFCFELDRHSWTGLGVQLAVAADEDERVVVRMDEHQSARARKTLGELPEATDLRCALRQVVRNKELSLDDFLPKRDELNEALRTLAPAMQLKPKVLGLDAAILHERMQSQLSSLALTHPRLPRLEPPPIPRRNERPNWNALPANTAIVSFSIDDDSDDDRIVGTLVHRNQASHWQVRAANEIRSQCDRWLATIMTLPTTVDEIEDDERRLRTQQMELELTQRLFPPLCGIDHPEIRHVIVVPSGFLWQLPFEELVIGHDANDQTQRWKDRGTVAYAHTLGTALSVATLPSHPFVPLESEPVAVWDATESEVSPSLEEPAPKMVSAGPVGSWGDSVWWGNMSRNLLVPPESAVPFAWQSESATSSAVHAWDRCHGQAGRHGQAGEKGLNSWVDLSSKFPPFGKVSQVLRPDIQNSLFVQASRLHAAGLEDVVLPRLPAMQEAGDLLFKELVVELGRVPFQEAWERSMEILRISEFTFPEGVGPVPFKDDVGEMTGDHPRVQLSYIHLSFSGL